MFPSFVVNQENGGGGRNGYLRVRDNEYERTATNINYDRRRASRSRPVKEQSVVK